MERSARTIRILVLVGAFAGVTSALACATSTTPGGPQRWSVASPDPAVLTMAPATFSDSSGIREAVLTECKLEFEIPERIAKQVPGEVALAENPEGGARVLQLEVTNILAPGGGVMSGQKSLTLHGELVEGGAVVASFDARRTTSRGAGTCEMLGIVVDAIAEDLRPWLAAPSVDAKLGELSAEEGAASPDGGDEDAADEGAAGEDAAGEDAAGEDAAGEDAAGEDAAGEDAAGEDG
jgi:hypothetical protein